jgi:hypothetical protein
MAGDRRTDRRRVTTRLTVAALCVVVSSQTAMAARNGNGGGGGGQGNCNKTKTCVTPPGADTVVPNETIDSPSNAANVAGTVKVSGTASDNVGVAAVDVAVDQGGFSSAAGTGSWVFSVDTTRLSNGSHSVTARATDTSGNRSSTQIVIDVSNATDTTAPKITIGAPADGSTASGTFTVSGTASDGTGLASIDVRIDGDTWKAATGAANWSASFDSTAYGDGSHTVTARALDAAGNATSTAIGLTFENATSTTTSSHIVTPEGVTIDVNSAGQWSAQDIYDLLRPSAYQLGLIGPSVTIKVQDTIASQTVTSAVSSGGTYQSFKATIYLKGVNSTFANQPDAQIAHEYGHAWSLYHLYMDHNRDWSSYLDARWANADGSVRLSGDAQLDSTYSWDRKEILAEDYRLLFGSAKAIAERPTQMNSSIPQPSNVPGLASFLGAW